MTTNAEPSELVRDLKRVVRDSEDLLQDSGEIIGEKAYALRERLDRTLESAKITCRRLEEKAKQGAKATDKVIRGHPYQSIGMACGIGVLIGVLVARR